MSHIFCSLVLPCARRSSRFELPWGLVVRGSSSNCSPKAASWVPLVGCWDWLSARWEFAFLWPPEDMGTSCREWKASVLTTMSSPSRPSLLYLPQCYSGSCRLPAHCESVLFGG